MNIKLLLLVFVIAFVILANLLEPPEPKKFVENITVSNYSNFFFTYDIISYPSKVEIAQPTDANGSIVLGFVVDNWNLNFGSVPFNGSYVTRNVQIRNSKESDVEIIMKAYGNITPLVSFEENNILLKPDENVSVNILLQSKDYEIGNYTGQIDVIIKKPIYNFLSIT